jgi:hypothetical protein
MRLHHQDSFIYHCLRVCFIVLIAYFLLCSVDLYGDNWWKQEVRFSDWRGVKCDYSTNAVVDWWYNGKHSKYFRQENIKEIEARLLSGDTLIVGLDYYALYGVSAQIMPREMLIRESNSLLSGKVITYKVHLDGNNIIWNK